MSVLVLRTNPARQQGTLFPGMYFDVWVENSTYSMVLIDWVSGLPESAYMLSVSFTSCDF